MKLRQRVLLLWAVVSLLTVPLSAQNSELGKGSGLGTQPNTVMGMESQMQRQFLVAGRVTTLTGTAVVGAKVEVKPLSVFGDTRHFKTDLKGEFRSVYTVGADFTNVYSPSSEIKVALTITKEGFLKAYVIADAGVPGKAYMVSVTLRSTEDDPEVLSQAELVSALAPKLKSLGPADGLSAKSEKDFARGVEEFLEKARPEQALSFLGKVADRDKTCVACRTMLGLAELNFGDWYGGNRDETEAARAVQADPTHGRPEPFVILGVMETWRHEPEKGAGFFLEALKSAPQDALALQELGRSQLLLANWGPASDYLGKAIAAGAGPEARMLRVKALLGQGQYDEATQELTRYLDGRDIKTMPLPVRMAWTQIQDRKKTVATYAKASTEIEEPIDYLRLATPELKDLEAARDQKPLEGILQAVGKNVAEFFKNFPNTSSLEEIHQEQLGRNGKTHKVQDSRYRYLCAIPAEAWGPGFDEYRMNVVKDEGLPSGLKEGFMLTAGFASAQILFHPVYQSQATFRYLGSQKLSGHDTWVVAFAQRPDTAQIHGVFRSGEVELTTFSQGLAWVDTQTYQIVRLRSDLLRPLPEVRLKKQTTDIDFAEVRFNRLQEAFWLPEKVTVTVDWNRHLLRNKHQYSEFKVFSVDSRQRFGKVNASTPVAKEPAAP
jgi:tetratricopeptide (TPR) repeat protein